jgi:hypothetical protein
MFRTTADPADKRCGRNPREEMSATLSDHAISMVYSDRTRRLAKPQRLYGRDEREP